ncbi:MAG: polyprenyl synthetase family protein [Myxococcota bacterium]
MNTTHRIEEALEWAVIKAERPGAPPTLGRAIRHAVFPGGARVRPRVCLAVAAACGDDEPLVADCAAAGIELLHCASLVHDDLPCFDDAELRRGRPSVHALFGEAIAVLAGDALIVSAFDVLSRALERAPTRSAPLLGLLTRASGSPLGLVAGQAWESEPSSCREEYHRAKTGSLFTAATVGGALAAGADPAPWRTLGDRLGEAYQVADDLRDAVAEESEIGKPVGQDAEHLRPNAVADLGVAGAVARLQQLVNEAVESIPECRGAHGLRRLVELQVKRLTPKALQETAA